MLVAGAERFRKAGRSLRLVAASRHLVRRARWHGRSGPVVLLSNLAQMGDVVLSAGVAAAVRERERDGIVLMVVRPEWRNIIEDDPVLDGVLSAQSLFEVRALARYGGPFDVVYLIELPIPNLIHYFVGLPNIYRYAPPTTGDWFRHGHLLSHYERNAGLAEGRAKPRIWIRACDRATVDELWRELDGRRGSGPIIALHTRSSVGTKNWPEDRFQELVNRWQDTHDAHFVVVGGKGEGERLRGQSNATVLGGRLTAKETAEVIRRCDFFVGLDSGLAYVAEAVGTPGLIIFGSTAPQTCGPRGPQYSAVRPAGACDPACHGLCVRSPHCIATLTVDEVDAAMRRAWYASQQAARALVEPVWRAHARMKNADSLEFCRHP